MSPVPPDILASIPSPATNRIEIGPLSVTFYGVALALGILAAFMLGSRRWKDRGGDPDEITRVGLWAVVAGVLGARVAYVLPRLDAYLDRPLSLLYIWEGGLAFFGGLVGGVLVGYLLVRRANLDIPSVLDTVAPVIPLAQAIGRWGNYFNQELFGRPTGLPWGLQIDPQRRPPQYADQPLFHPTFLYESLWNLAVVGLLLWLDRKRALPRGALFAVYVVLYGAARFALEQLRIDTAFRFLGLSRNAWFSLGIALAGAVALILLRRRSKDDEEPDVTAATEDGPTPDAAAPTPDAAAPTPDAAAPTPDAAAPTPEGASPPASAAEPAPGGPTPPAEDPPHQLPREEH